MASDDELLRHVGEAYLDEESLYCPEEDDVVPLAWSYKDEAERAEAIADQHDSSLFEEE